MAERSTFDRKRYAREYARQRRAANLATAIASAGRRCPARLGRTTCGGLLVDDVDRDGRVTTSCDWCERRRAGKCRECGRPVAGTAGKAIRCAFHKKLAAHAAQAKYKTLHAKQVRDGARLRERARVRAMTPAEYQAHLDRKCAWRHANPTRVQRMKERERARDPKANAARTKRWREQQPAGYWRRYTRGAATHPCTGPRLAPGTCAGVLTGRPKKCADCKAADRREGRSILIARVESSRQPRKVA